MRAGARWLAAAALLATATAAACSSDPSPQAQANRPADHPATGKGSGSPAHPPRDGTLDQVHVKLTRIAHVEEPTALVPRANTASLYVTERAGRVRRLAAGPDGTYTVISPPLLDLSTEVNTNGEMGMLGLTFSPDGSQLFVDYNTHDAVTHLVRYDVTGDQVLTATRKELFSLPQPFPNHKGGDLHFGPDGKLYFGLGDGGAANDPDQRAQNPHDFHGKLLRFDPNGGPPQVYLLGLRNPWRFAFDAQTHDLWIGDVGQDHVEEIDHLRGTRPDGTNMGWSGLEGTRVNIPERIKKPSVPPVFEYTHDDGGCAITGGFVYRGQKVPALVGTYLFADLCLPAIHGLKTNAKGNVVDERSLGISMAQVISFAQDSHNELYVLSLEGGIFRVDPA